MLLLITLNEMHAQSVGLLWTSDQSVAETSDNIQLSRATDIHAPAGFEPAIPTRQRPQAYALDRAFTGIGSWLQLFIIRSPLMAPCVAAAKQSL